MKLAVLLFGDYREFEKASISYDFFKEYDIDFYISTWKQTNSYDSNYNLTKKEITEESFNNFLPKKPTFLSISDEESFSDLDYTQKMVKHWKILGEGLKNRKSEYTSVLLIRIEFYITYFDFNLLVDEGKSGKLHIINRGMVKEGNDYFVNDISHSGSTEVILNYIDMLRIYPALVAHTDFGNLLFNSNIEVEEQKSILGILLRPTTSPLLGNNHIKNLSIIENNSDEISELHEIFSKWHHTYSIENPPKKTFKQYFLENYK